MVDHSAGLDIGAKQLGKEREKNREKIAESKGEKSKNISSIDGNNIYLICEKWNVKIWPLQGVFIIVWPLVPCIVVDICKRLNVFF